jgi:hypothetical protein
MAKTIRSLPFLFRSSLAPVWLRRHEQGMPPRLRTGRINRASEIDGSDRPTAAQILILSVQTSFL